MILNPKAIKHVVLDGHSLTLESFVAVARYGAAGGVCHIVPYGVRAVVPEHGARGTQAFR